MTNICTKVTVRKRPIKNGQVSLYLDFYPPVRHPKTGKLTRREYLGIYIYANPTENADILHTNVTGVFDFLVSEIMEASIQSNQSTCKSVFA